LKRCCWQTQKRFGVPFGIAKRPPRHLCWQHYGKPALAAKGVAAALAFPFMMLPITTPLSMH
jgi:hypothetical protein